MYIGGTHIQYYHVCKRKLWLFGNGIRMEDNSEAVKDGKLIHETSYPQRSAKYEEIEVGGIKVDYFDRHERVIHEIKRSNKIERAHIWQLKYYIYVFERNGIEGCTGILEYPTLRETMSVLLDEDDKVELEHEEKDIEEIVTAETCPHISRKTICKSCSYYDFCYSSEPEEV